MGAPSSVVIFNTGNVSTVPVGKLSAELELLLELLLKLLEELLIELSIALLDELLLIRIELLIELLMGLSIGPPIELLIELSLRLLTELLMESLMELILEDEIIVAAELIGAEEFVPGLFESEPPLPPQACNSTTKPIIAPRIIADIKKS